MGAASTTAAAGLPDWLIRVLGHSHQIVTSFTYAHLATFYSPLHCVWLLSPYQRRLRKLVFCAWGIHAVQVSVVVKSHSDFPKLFSMLCYVLLFICLYSCPVQHMPVESSHSDWEIGGLNLNLNLNWPEVQLAVPWRVRLLDCVDLLLYQPTICLV